MPVCRRAADITACVDAGREAQGREVSMSHFSGRRRLMIHLGAETRRALAITARATAMGPRLDQKEDWRDWRWQGLGAMAPGGRRRENGGAPGRTIEGWPGLSVPAQARARTCIADADGRRRVGVTGGGIVTGRGRWRLPTGGRWPSWAPHRPEDEGGRDRHPSFPACPPRRCAKLCAHDTLVDLVPSGMHFDSFPSRWIVRVVL